MFRPPGLLATQVAPTAVIHRSVGSRGVSIRACHASLPPHAPEMLAARMGNWRPGTVTPSDSRSCRLLLPSTASRPASQTRPARTTQRLSPLPAFPLTPPVCLGPSRGDGYPTPWCVPGESPHGHSGRVLPQYPRRWTPRVLRSGRGRLSLPSSPLRPDPPVSPAPTDFTAPRRLDRGPSLSGRARGHRRDLPGFGCPALFDGRPVPTPGDRSPATTPLLRRAPRPSRNPDTLGIALSPSQP